MKLPPLARAALALAEAFDQYDREPLLKAVNGKAGRKVNACLERYRRAKIAGLKKTVRKETTMKEKKKI